MDSNTHSSEYQILAWQGVEVLLMNDWRPLRFEGNHFKGSFTVGDQDGAIFILRWIHPPKKYKASDWIEKRQKSVAAGQVSENPPRPARFETSSWIKSLAVREEAEKTVWWGYSSDCSVLIEVILTNLTDRKKNDWFIKYSLPKLKVFSQNEKWLWQIYSARFLIPAGYILNKHRLSVGDIALDFFKNKSDRLLVRQVYPAKLALERRSLPAWLRDEVFKRHRKFKVINDDKNIKLKSKKTGWKCLPFPLGWISPHACERLIVEDRDLDRLYIVDAEWRKSSNAFEVDSLITEMGKQVA